MATIRQYDNNNIVITEGTVETMLPTGVVPQKRGTNVYFLDSDLKTVKILAAADVTQVTDKDGTATPITDIDTLYNTLRDSFFFRVAGGTGLGAVPFAIRSTDSLPAVFTSLANRDTYYTTNPGDIADTTDLGRGLEAVGIGPNDGNTVGVTAAFIRNAANDDWIPIATNFIGPQGPPGADSTVPGPTGPPGDLFVDVEITADLTINVANLATYENRNVVNVRNTIGQVTVTMDTIANFLTADPTDEIIFRFINESDESTMVISPATGNFFAQISGSVTLNRGQVLEIKLPQAGTRWNVLNESTTATAGIVPPPVTPTPLPDGNMAVVGDWDPTTGSFPASASQGDVYNITASGTVDSIAFFRGDFLIAEVATPSTSTFTGNWGVIPGKGSVHSLFGRQGVIDDAFMIANLDRLGYIRNSGTVNPSFHEFVVTTIPARVDLNTDLSGTQTISFSVTNHGDVSTATVQADFTTPDDFADVVTIVNPTIDGTQTQQVTFSSITTDTQKTIAFRIRAIDNQGNVHISNEYNVEVRTLTTQEQAHFGFIQSTETANDIVFANDDIEARANFAGAWTVSGIPSDSNVYRLYLAVPAGQASVTRVIQNGADITSQFANVNVNIDANNYNVFLLNIASAVNSNYNGTILNFS